MKSKSTNTRSFIKITDKLTVNNFEKIKTYILENGDTQTYRNFDNKNPHYKTASFDAYLGSDIGQKNINNNPKLSNFNQLTIRDSLTYYEMIIVRKGDIIAMKSWIVKGMEENEVYLTDYRQENIGQVPTQLMTYLQHMLKD